MPRLVRLVVFAGTCAGAAACSDADEGGGAPLADEYAYDCTSPLASGRFATDESFMAIVDKEAAGAVVTDDAKAPKLTGPLARALSAGTPPTFTFDAVSADARRIPQPASSFRRRLWRFLSPIGTAEAHCAGVTGDNYLLRLRPANGGAPVYTAVLSVRSFTPDRAVWARKLGGRVGQTLNLTLVRAVLAGGIVTEGPFAPRAPTAFSVTP